MNLTAQAIEEFLPLDKRILPCILLMMVVAFSFWGSSRYPSLDDKALMGGQFVLNDALSFDAAWELPKSSTAVSEPTFQNPKYYATQANLGRGIKIADMNNDGVQDIVYVSGGHRNGPNYVYWGSSNGFSDNNRKTI